MENASKALMMAGGILIALLIIGALTMMIVNLSDFENSEQQREQEGIIADFNIDYIYYDSKELSFMEVKSLYNKVQSNNANKSNPKVEIDIQETHTVVEKYYDGKNVQDVIKYDSSDIVSEVKILAKFIGKIEYGQNGYISKIIITEKE